MRSERVIDVDWAPARVFAVLSDPRRLGEWSTMMAPANPWGSWSNGDDLAMRWTWRGRNELVNAHLELGDNPFTVRWEGKTDDGTRFEVRHGIEAHETGSRVDVIVDLEPSPTVSTIDDGSLQRVLDRDLETMTARLFALIDRYGALPAPQRSAARPAPAASPVEPRTNRTTVAGRSLHRTVTPVVLALFGLTLVADMWYSLHERSATADLAGTLAVVAALAALFAGAVGVVDLTRNRAARGASITWLHGAGNVVVIALAVLNAARRIDHPRATIEPWGLVTSSVIVALVTLTWFGGRAAAARSSDAPLDAAGVEASGGE